MTLTPLAPSRAHADAVRRRCHARLARGAKHTPRIEASAPAWRSLAAPALLGAFSMFYAAVLFTETLRVEGWLR